MKKLVVLLLALAMCLSMAACGATEDEKALEAANALFEAGDYEAALEAYANIPMVIEVSEKMSEAQLQITLSQLSPYVGIWKDLTSTAEVSINADGSFSCISAYGDSFDGNVYMDADSIVLDSVYTISEIEGVVHLSDDFSDFVPAEHHEALAAKHVEVTVDNWQTYFEICDAVSKFSDSSGDVSNVNFGSGIVLKDEYAAKLANEWDSVSVSFNLTYDQEYRFIEGDYPNGDFYLGDQFESSMFLSETQEAEVMVYLAMSYEGYESNLADKYVADLAFGGGFEFEGKMITMIPSNIQILGVTGTLYMFD